MSDIPLDLRVGESVVVKGHNRQSIRRAVFDAQKRYWRLTGVEMVLVSERCPEGHIVRRTA